MIVEIENSHNGYDSLNAVARILGQAGIITYRNSFFSRHCPVVYFTKNKFCYFFGPIGGFYSIELHIHLM